MYEAPYVVLAHDSSADPIFFYGNLKAQEVFDMSWTELTNLPSKYSAEPISQNERAKLLKEVLNKGYIDNYSGIRISKNGTRFLIKNATVWNLNDKDNVYCGQAATFDQISPLNL